MNTHAFVPMCIASVPMQMPARPSLARVIFTLAKRRRLRGFASTASEFESPTPCRLCNGSGRRVCETCAGRGVLEHGGFVRRNPVRLDTLVGSKWTAVTAIEGKWRHFVCVGRRGRTVRQAVAQLSSTCGPREERLAIDVPVTQLKDRTAWTGGWTTLEAIHAGKQRTTCSGCSGLCEVPCPRCDGLGMLY